MQLMKKLIEDNKILENDLIKSKSEKDELEKSLNIARTELEGNQKKCNEIEEIIVQKINESEKINNDLLNIRHRMEISAIQVSGYEEKLEELTVELFSEYSYSVEDLEKIFSVENGTRIAVRQTCHPGCSRHSCLSRLFPLRSKPFLPSS